jgi:hypothetical protein
MPSHWRISMPFLSSTLDSWPDLRDSVGPSSLWRDNDDNFWHNKPTNALTALGAKTYMENEEIKAEETSVVEETVVVEEAAVEVIEEKLPETETTPT